MASGHVDFSIGAPEQSAADVDTRTLRRDHLALVVPRSHPLAGLRQVRWAQRAGHAVITVRPGYGIRPLIDATAGRAGVALNVVNEVAFLATALWRPIAAWAQRSCRPPTRRTARTPSASCCP